MKRFTVGIACPSQILAASGGVPPNIVLSGASAGFSMTQGATQSMTVWLAVTATPPQLSVGSSLLSFTSQISNPQTFSAQLAISSADGDTLTGNFVSAAGSWLSIAGVPPTIPAGTVSSVTVTTDPTSLQAGYYTSSITVSSSAGNTTVPVTPLMSGGFRNALGPAGSQFSMT